MSNKRLMWRTRQHIDRQRNEILRLSEAIEAGMRELWHLNNFTVGQTAIIFDKRNLQQSQVNWLELEPGTTTRSLEALERKGVVQIRRNQGAVTFIFTAEGDWFRRNIVSLLSGRKDLREKFIPTGWPK